MPVIITNTTDNNTNIDVVDVQDSGLTLSEQTAAELPTGFKYLGQLAGNRGNHNQETHLLGVNTDS